LGTTVLNLKFDTEGGCRTILCGSSEDSEARPVIVGVDCVLFDVAIVAMVLIVPITVVDLIVMDNGTASITGTVVVVASATQGDVAVTMVVAVKQRCTAIITGHHHVMVSITNPNFANFHKGHVVHVMVGATVIARPKVFCTWFANFAI
jgi:hypothetical protein